MTAVIKHIQGHTEWVSMGLLSLTLSLNVTSILSVHLHEHLSFNQYGLL